jgi:hyperosmotically inducible protein
MWARRLIRLLLAWAVVTIPGLAQGQDRPLTTAVSDAWITTQVQASYFVDDLVKGRRIDVDTNHGVVTLTGQVSSQAERQRALARARDIAGVTRVIDRLKVAAETAGTSGRDEVTPPKNTAKRKDRGDNALDRVDDEISDGWITTKVQSKFYLDPDVKGLRINVSTNGGVVTLAGKVDTDGARNKALGLAKSTDGVKQVIDKLAVEKR